MRWLKLAYHKTRAYPRELGGGDSVAWRVRLRQRSAILADEPAAADSENGRAIAVILSIARSFARRVGGYDARLCLSRSGYSLKMDASSRTGGASKP
jgi:hypothetical protein